MSVKRRPVKLPAGSKTHITDQSRKGVGTLVRTLCGLYVIREQVDNLNASCQKCLRFRHSRSRVK